MANSPISDDRQPSRCSLAPSVLLFPLSLLGRLGSSARTKGKGPHTGRFGASDPEPRLRPVGGGGGELLVTSEGTCEITSRGVRWAVPLCLLALNPEAIPGSSRMSPYWVPCQNRIGLNTSIPCLLNRIRGAPGVRALAIELEAQADPRPEHVGMYCVGPRGTREASRSPPPPRDFPPSITRARFGQHRRHRDGRVQFCAGPPAPRRCLHARIRIWALSVCRSRFVADIDGAAFRTWAINVVHRGLARAACRACGHGRAHEISEMHG